MTILKEPMSVKKYKDIAITPILTLRYTHMFFDQKELISLPDLY